MPCGLGRWTDTEKGRTPVPRHTWRPPRVQVCYHCAHQRLTRAHVPQSVLPTRPGDRSLGNPRPSQPPLECGRTAQCTGKPETPVQPVICPRPHSFGPANTPLDPENIRLKKTKGTGGGEEEEKRRCRQKGKGPGQLGRGVQGLGPVSSTRVPRGLDLSSLPLLAPRAESTRPLLQE